MLAALLDKTGTLQVPTPATDAAGGTTRTWANSGSAFACALWPRSSALAKSFARNDILGTHVIATAASIGAKANNRISLGGVYYLVNGVEPFSNAGVTGETLYLYDVTLRTV